MRPRLLRSDLTGAVYVVTRYREHEDGIIEAVGPKYDVTGDFVRLFEAEVDRWRAEQESKPLDSPLRGYGGSS